MWLLLCVDVANTPGGTPVKIRGLRARSVPVSSLGLGFWMDGESVTAVDLMLSPSRYCTIPTVFVRQ